MTVSNRRQIDNEFESMITVGGQRRKLGCVADRVKIWEAELSGED